MIRLEKPRVVHAVLAINPEADVCIRSSSNIDTCTFEWNGGTTPISRADIKTKFEELTNEYNAQVYARNRQKKYPVMQDFMEAYCEKEIGGDSTKWDAYVVKYNKVRTDNQKP